MKILLLLVILIQSQTLEELQLKYDSLKTQCDINWNSKCEREVRILESKITNFNSYKEPIFYSGTGSIGNSNGSNYSNYASAGNDIKTTGILLIVGSLFAASTMFIDRDKDPKDAKIKLNILTTCSVISYLSGAGFLISAGNKMKY
jgi:hypothetical protein